MIAAAVSFIAITVLEALFHEFVLGSAYQATASLWRTQTEMQQLLPLGWITNFIVSMLLVYIYHRGYEGKGCNYCEGLRFGLLIGLFVSLPMAVWSYITIPMPTTIAIGWFIIGMIDMLIAGVIIGGIYRPQEV